VKNSEEPLEAAASLAAREAHAETQVGTSARLDSWKEIAAYLRRSVRCVQRWEKNEGLPIRRIAQRPGTSVYAFPDELESWWRAGGRTWREATAKQKQEEIAVRTEKTREMSPGVGEISPGVQDYNTAFERIRRAVMKDKLLALRTTFSRSITNTGGGLRSILLRIGLSILLITLPTQSQASELQVIQTPATTQEPNASAGVATSSQDNQQGQVNLPKGETNEQFALLDGTPIKLKISRSVSSSDASAGQSVDFEVQQDVLINGTVVIAKGAVAMGSVTQAVPKRRMGRAGKLEIVLEYVRLTDTEKVPVRAVKNAKGQNRTGGMTVGIVATGLLFWPAAPLFLLMHGKDITVPQGAEVTAYVNGDTKLDAAKFGGKVEATATATATMPAEPQSGLPPQPAPVDTPLGAVEVQSSPGPAAVYADGLFVGNTPANLKLSAGTHAIRVTLDGHKEWAQNINIQASDDLNLSANLEKQQ
jgi:PEGA domain